MQIVTPQGFLHAGTLSQRYASVDPRRSTFHEAELDIDMRQCEFIRPAAVLWCVIYPLLAANRGSKCRLLVPDDMGVCTYLKSVGLLGTLKAAGVEVDDRGIMDRGGAKIILPLTELKTETEVEDAANKALEALGRAGLGAANIRPLVSEVFAELALNAVQHSDSPVNAYGFIQFHQFEQGSRFVCAVADGGVGIRASLERNPELRSRVPYDWVAIELALRERVSGTGIGTRGIGLYGIAEDMRRQGRQLIIHSGLGMLATTEEAESQSQRSTLFPGTLAYASIAT